MNQENTDQAVYQAPAIVFESTITTRAGSPVAPRGDESIDLFDN